MPAYAECGGLMYLSRKLHWLDKSFDMVGVIAADTSMHEMSCGRGYVKLEEVAETSPWGLIGDSNKLIHAHEFHYSTVNGLPENAQYAYRVKRGAGIDQHNDGLVYKNLLASYSHLRNTRSTPWVERFLSFVSNKKAASKLVRFQ